MIESFPQDEIPHITIIRPAKGLEPKLYECLAATFRQTYPVDKLSIRFCVANRHDPAYPTLERLVEDFPAFDAQIFIADEDPNFESGSSAELGPNPKIRNMSRAYREAKGDIIWIIDCNVWIGHGVAGRMVDRLFGLGEDGMGKKYKFVHQIPLVVDITEQDGHSENLALLGAVGSSGSDRVASTSTTATRTISTQDMKRMGLLSRIFCLGGGRLEEMFLASSHAKFYTAINTVLVAPCIVGKSNMFRKSHLDYITAQGKNSPATGIDYFSYNICEDHLIGDLLWKSTVPEEIGPNAEILGKHMMLFGDPAIQPMAGMSVSEYTARRVRWLRVRKFTVTLATFVEPGTECFLCSLYGAFAVTTLPFFQNRLGIPPTWSVFAAFWLLSVSIWALMDWTLYQILHNMASVEVDENTPAFAKGRLSGPQRTFLEWLPAWVGREALALPIWTWAVYGGVTVQWRGQKFRVGMDMKVHALDSNPPVTTQRTTSGASGDRSGKARRE